LNQSDKQQGAAQSALVSLQSLLSQAQSQQATGRMVVRMRDLAQLENSTDNVLLVNGDTIAIPRMPASVNILGSVNSPGSITTQPGWTVRDYLSHAGGAGPFADTKLMMVIKADGSAITQQGLDNASRFPLSLTLSGGLEGLHLQGGDTIYVPPDIQSFVKTKYWLDVTGIVSNTAQSFAILGLLATKL
jgi:protein involved in polysaccharide export with SLBB domain